MILASSLNPGKTDALLNLADDLTVMVRKAAEDGTELDVVERAVLAQVLKLGHAAVSLFLEAQGDGDLGVSIGGEDGSVLHRSDSIQKRPLRTIFGEHTLHTYVYSQGNKQKITLRPVDAGINLPEGKASYLLQEFTQLFCVEKAFRVGAQQFATVFGQKISVDVLEDINRGMGEQAD